MSYFATLTLGRDAAQRRRAISQARVQLGQSMRFVSQQCMQLHGGIGVTDEYVGSHYFKRLTMLEMSFGDTLHHLGEVSGPHAGHGRRVRLTMVCVFNYPGALRKVFVGASTTGLLLAILWLDGSGIFYTSGAAMNLVALAIVALLLDAHLMAMGRALFDEKRLVEHERARADAVLFNALPMPIANELKRSKHRGGTETRAGRRAVRRHRRFHRLCRRTGARCRAARARRHLHRVRYAGGPPVRRRSRPSATPTW
jgi:hypothetical protein